MRRGDCKQKYKTQNALLRKIYDLKIQKTIVNDFSHRYNGSGANRIRNSPNPNFPMKDSQNWAAVHDILQKWTSLCLPSPSEVLVCS